MVASKKDETSEPRRRPRFVRSWLLGLLALSIAALYFYHQHRQSQEALLNSYYLRTLGEVAVEFNANLDQLFRLHRYGRGKAEIRAIFPSYDGPEAINDDSSAEYEIRIGGGQVTGQRTGAPGANDAANTDEGEKKKTVDESFDVFKVSIEDMLPGPRGDFSAYLLVGEGNKVLGTAGGLGALSIVSTRDISERVWEEKSQDWLKLAAREGSDTAPDELPLPGSSHHVDMQLAARDARIFVYPFPTKPWRPPGADSGDNGASSDIYLVGVVPEVLLNRQEGQRWQVSVLLLALTALGFLWTLLRLFMLSNHQPVSTSFYVAALSFSYLLFVLSAAALFSWGEQRAEVDHKHGLAEQLITDITFNFKSDLHDVFDQMHEFRLIYQMLFEWEAEQLAGSEDEPGGKSLRAIPPELTEPQAPLTRAQMDDLLGILAALPGDGRAGAVVLRDGRRWRLNDKGEYEFSVMDEPPGPEEPDGDQKYYRALNRINVIGPGADLISDDSFNVGFTPVLPKAATEENPVTPGVPGKILNVFLMNHAATQTMPVFYLRESNNRPQRFNLAHRYYFSNIRDQESWEQIHGDLTVTEGQIEVPKEIFYIQRLLNLTTGTRGTTLGMPYLKDPDAEGHAPEARTLVMGSDIVLPSLSLIEPCTLDLWRAAVKTDATDETAATCKGGQGESSRPLLLDMKAMVVDQRTGVVLYHVDEDRSMIENLFRSGRGADDVSQFIQLDRATRDFEPVKGYYHGERGWFHTAPLAPAPWSVVVFVPAANTDSYMMNLFLVSGASMTVALLLFALGLLIVRRTVDTEAFKRSTGIPLAVDRLRLILFASVMVAAVQLGYFLGSALERDLDIGTGNYSMMFSSGALLLTLIWGAFEYWRCSRQPYEVERAGRPPGPVAVLLGLAFLALGGAQIAHLHWAGKEPIGALEHYYQKLYDSRVNKEKTELEQVALTRFQNSITRQRVPPLDLMPISHAWRNELKEAHSVVVPEDVGPFSKLTRTDGVGQWLKRYVRAGAENSKGRAEESDFLRWGPELQYYAWMAAYFVLLVLLWVWFNARVLAVRLFGPPGLLIHLSNLSERAGALETSSPEDCMVLDLTNQPSGGLSLALLLQDLKARKGAGSLQEEFEGLVSLCPLLDRAKDEENPFPCMKIRLTTVDGLPCIELWDLEDSLARPNERALLLRLLNQLVSLKSAGKIGALRIFLGFHTLERLLLKANMIRPSDVAGQWLTSREYSAWADCLMDFRVRLPDKLLALVDPAVIEQECRHFPIIRDLVAKPGENECAKLSRKPNNRRWADLRDWQKDPSEWASINAILLSAGALFRAKWESCSTAERLALYHLALHKRVNPFNTEMLEQLALKGLIVVERGRIQIVNNSFAYFVRHAEDPQTLKDLVESADAGPWRDYRLPVTLLILIGLVAIALTSGNSLYVIVASLLGLLGTLGTLTNSARLIQENLNR